MGLAGVLATLGAVASAVAIILIVVAPWKRVRAEGRLPADTETRLLLGEDPSAVAAEEHDQRPGASPDPLAERPEAS